MIKFTLDPGHNKDYNAGCIRGYFEGNKVFRLANMLKEELEKFDGVEVVMTKDTVEANPGLDARGKTAVNNGSKVFVSLHSDADSTGEAHGVTVIRSLKLPNSDYLGNKLGNKVASIMGTNYRYGDCMTRVYPNTRDTDYYGVIRAAVGGNVEYIFIIEHGFHSNYANCSFLNDDNNLRKLAVGEAEVYAEYFGLKRKEEIKLETITDFNRALDVMVEKQIISDKQYWASLVGTINYIENLYVNIANTLIKVGHYSGSMTDPVAAVNLFAALGVVNSPDYWMNLIGKINYIDLLYLRTANKFVA